MAKLTDSLITANAFYSFTRTDSMPGDSSTRTRQYYFDTESRCMVKCIIDTCFEDFHQTKYRQVVIYFHRGSWYHVAWQNAQTLEFDFGFNHGDFLKSNSAYKKAGRFRKKAVQEIIDRNMRDLVSEEIANSKFMQSRNFGN